VSLPPPTAEFQIRFLQDLQRILEEGQFTATYKFALIHALADLSVQRGDDSGDSLRLPVRSITERMVELYWRQVKPWQTKEAARVLVQNTGGTAAVVEWVREARAKYSDRLDLVRREGRPWSRLLSRVNGTVRRDPLKRLQSVGGSPHVFLYEPEPEGRGADAFITLRPGVAFCFRTFHPLVTDLVQSAWVRFVRRFNSELLGETQELGEFLFGAPRAAMSALREPLREVQQDLCFYCAKRLGDRCHVDHFIPWSRYPLDLGHNFVLAHDRCNGDKADHLAAVQHLSRWATRNREQGYHLGLVFEEAGFMHDLSVSTRITRWAYAQVGQRGGRVWHRGSVLEPLGSNWESFLG